MNKIPVDRQDPVSRQAIGPKASEEELISAAKRILPDATTLADMLARVRYSTGDIDKAFLIVLQRIIGETMANTAADYVLEHLERLLPAAINKILESDWEAHVNGHRVKDNLASVVKRKLEDAVAANIAAKYEIDVDVRFRRKA